MKYELKVPTGTYKHDNLFLLIFNVIKHRLTHLIKDGKYIAMISHRDDIKNSVKIIKKYL